MTSVETQSMPNALRRNHDIFAWAHADMKGIHPSIASHKLNIKLWIPLPGKECSISWMPSPDITRFPCPRLTRKNSIHNAKRLYCYKVMPFGLKNAGATYQRLMTKIFKPLIGHTVEQRGIEVSPDQVKAVMETPPPRSKKELQRLTGKLVALGRFIARFTDELRPFFLAIRKAGANGWTDSCQNAFEKIKHCLMQPPS
ncbi:hypothetical protein CK203_112961 [Vitis vinifera]|uniref:Reverse transcriptase/retrotransposon-derived protein RNase H-like domain-containing protein n=1 Tax=Vitis vinifera TaxID=29760 RepID=A0A438EB51_VITVI|nr:hypothetical protein CK203_112961 [Vitis vinifera]